MKTNPIVVVCNGEIYNYRELRSNLVKNGHTFRTGSDIEVLAHLYEEDGVDFINKLNGQFAFALLDRKQRKVLLARDHFGVNPLYYTIVDDVPDLCVRNQSHTRAPDGQARSGSNRTRPDLFVSGIVSPRTMFKNINSLKSGGFLLANSHANVGEYWDLDYPRIGEVDYKQTEAGYVDNLRNHVAQAVGYRLQADVPVGFYLSGGQDSSMIAAQIHKLSPHVQRHSFSIAFTDNEINEQRFQRMMAKISNSVHHEIVFDWSEISDRLTDMVYHCECPVKETYNTCSYALSEAARKAGIKVVLSGEGADELFAGYVGYRYDQFDNRRRQKRDLETVLEDEIRTKLWGDKNVFYENDYYPLLEIKSAIYSEQVNRLFPQFDCVNFEIVNKERLQGRHFIHQRSYLDFKLRLADHLLSDHGDRMALANSVECRYPFLDIGLVEFAKEIPPDLKLNEFTEKYILKKAAQDLVPQQILKREKFGFRAPGSPFLLQQNLEWINDLLSYERIKRQGYFNPDTIETLKSQYSEPGFRLHPHLELDLLIMVLTFGLLVDLFELPSLN